MIVRSLLAAGLLAAALVACDASCTPTTTTARDASAVVGRDLLRSGVVSATLTTEGDRAVSGKTIDFFVEDTRLGADTTDSRGVATVDLKGKPLKLIRAATKDEYTAAFGGDFTYCSSRGEAAFDLVKV